MLCSTREKVEHHFLAGLSTMASLHHLSLCKVLQMFSSGSKLWICWISSKYWFSNQIEMVKVQRIERKSLIESIDYDYSVIFYLSNVFKNIDCWILWCRFQSMFCLLMTLQRCWLCEALVAGQAPDLYKIRRVKTWKRQTGTSYKMSSTWALSSCCGTSRGTSRHLLEWIPSCKENI